MVEPRAADRNFEQRSEDFDARQTEGDHQRHSQREVCGDAVADRQRGDERQFQQRVEQHQFVSVSSHHCHGS